MKEEWRDIPGLAGMYQASTLGRVRSLDRLGRNLKALPGAYLKPKISRNGYSTYFISCAAVGLRGNKLTHRIVAETFLENPHSKPCVNHIDGDKLNNRVENLEWCTYGENTHHAVSTGLFDHISGEGSHLSKFKIEEIMEIVSLLRDGQTPSSIARTSKISRPVISKINRGVCWRRPLKANGVTEFPINGRHGW